MGTFIFKWYAGPPPSRIHGRLELGAGIHGPRVRSCILSGTSPELGGAVVVVPQEPYYYSHTAS